MVSPRATYSLLTFPYIGFLGIQKIILGVFPWVGDFGKHLSRLWESGGTLRLRAFVLRGQRHNPTALSQQNHPLGLMSGAKECDQMSKGRTQTLRHVAALQPETPWLFIAAARGVLVSLPLRAAAPLFGQFKICTQQKFYLLSCSRRCVVGKITLRRWCFFSPYGLLFLTITSRFLGPQRVSGRQATGPRA